MEKLGIKFSDDADFLNEASIKLVFVFYMLLYFTCHENVGPIRKELRLKLFFYAWSDGNPSSPQNQ
jgi:hypothetical protein